MEDGSVFIHHKYIQQVGIQISEVVKRANHEIMIEIFNITLYICTESSILIV